MSAKTLRYLRSKEWSMGNGQCDECCGAPADQWLGHPCHPTVESCGHEKNCGLAHAIEALGGDVEWIE